MKRCMSTCSDYTFRQQCQMLSRQNVLSDQNWGQRSEILLYQYHQVLSGKKCSPLLFVICVRLLFVMYAVLYFTLYHCVHQCLSVMYPCLGFVRKEAPSTVIPTTTQRGKCSCVSTSMYMFSLSISHPKFLIQYLIDAKVYIC